ncbi:NAD-dependent deacylase [Pseudogracilibacillus auburnensis]|uniref:NAD-dependent deacylase n=1 Tax=Pseudogracilibacillus auburnensis TaxID=1494959 RepID=UPI001A95F5B7|nr:NAD-dependent deacylase [Pseudogracilibacillus auburnensis]MBO1002191.1 NAD-dependent deacylase [Pseudogracilibacillus auburnensis]
MDTLRRLLREANHTIIFTGAGMSTESGLPDFRSKDRGLWEKFNPSELANVHALLHNTEEFTNFYRYRLSEINKYQPHKGHLILAEWEKTGRIKGIITQNVDAFHHDAGSSNVMELHGSFRTFHCHNCHKEYERNAYLDGQTTCDCGGTIRPGIVLFGENLPQDTFRKAEQEASKADLFIVLGSSLSVSPANMFPLVAKENGAKLVIINREPTDYDMYADVVIQDKGIKSVLVELDNYFRFT